MTKSKPRKNRTPTVKERKLVKQVIKNGGNATKAAMKVYDVKDKRSAASLAHTVLHKPSITELLSEEMERQGITAEAIVAPVAKGLVAVNSDGSEDIPTQLSAHDRAIKMLKLTEPPEKTASPSISFNINKANFGGEFVHHDDD